MNCPVNGEDLISAMLNGSFRRAYAADYKEFGFPEDGYACSVWEADEFKVIIEDAAPPHVAIVKTKDGTIWHVVFSEAKTEQR